MWQKQAMVRGCHVPEIGEQGIPIGCGHTLRVELHTVQGHVGVGKSHDHIPPAMPL